MGELNIPGGIRATIRQDGFENCVCLIGSTSRLGGGEKGFINSEILKRHLPEQYKRFVYFVCGPTPLMDAMEETLPVLGVPAEKVFSERFGMV